MAQGNKELSSKLAKSTGAMVPSGFEHNVKQWYVGNRKRLTSLVGGQEERVAVFIAAAFAQVNRVPELINCTPESFFQCLIHSMSCNLMPGPMAEAYYLPFGNEATFVPSYQGLVKLVYNGGFVTKIHAQVVYEKDEFDFDPVEDRPYHRIYKGSLADRGKKTHVYCAIKNIHGETQYTVLTTEEVESVRARSRGAKSKFSPWNSEHETDVQQMFMKTAFKRAAKWIPKSPNPVAAMHFGKAIELDNFSDNNANQPVELLNDDVSALVDDFIRSEQDEKV